jgi:hypothetical protein
VGKLDSADTADIEEDKEHHRRQKAVPLMAAWAEAASAGLEADEQGAGRRDETAREERGDDADSCPSAHAEA